MGCNDDSVVKKETYEINELNTSGISGTVTFRRIDNVTTRVTVELTGTSSPNIHPSHIHYGSVSSPGGIAITLTSIDGATGLSETLVTQLDDVTPISYEELVTFDGYVNVHESAGNLGTLLAQGNIGVNY
jgi:hypothetical protein